MTCQKCHRTPAPLDGGACAVCWRAFAEDVSTQFAHLLGEKNELVRENQALRAELALYRAVPAVEPPALSCAGVYEEDDAA